LFDEKITGGTKSRDSVSVWWGKLLAPEIPFTTERYTVILYSIGTSVQILFMANVREKLVWYPDDASPIKAILRLPIPEIFVTKHP
jgi:hypothetical protein